MMPCGVVRQLLPAHLYLTAACLFRAPHHHYPARAGAFWPNMLITARARLTAFCLQAWQLPHVLHERLSGMRLFATRLHWVDHLCISVPPHTHRVYSFLTVTITTSATRTTRFDATSSRSNICPHYYRVRTHRGHHTHYTAQPDDLPAPYLPHTTVRWV